MTPPPLGVGVGGVARFPPLMIVSAMFVGVVAPPPPLLGRLLTVMVGRVVVGEDFKQVGVVFALGGVCGSVLMSGKLIWFLSILSMIRSSMAKTKSSREGGNGNYINWRRKTLSAQTLTTLIKYQEICLARALANKKGSVRFT